VTPRLALRGLVAADLDFLATMLGDAQVMRFYPARLTRAGAEDWLARQWARYQADGHGFWLVTERAEGTPLGQAGLLMQTVAAFGDARLPEIGYLLHASYWGRGYATEAACAVRDFAFGRCGYPRVVSLIRPENTPSQAVARRVGLRPTAETLHAGLVHEVWIRDASEPARGESAPPAI
jgi:[ribosomal protein S5]-alanine N-acetyltransferase